MNADIPARTRIGEDQAALIVEVFRMLADVTRVQVLWALADRELSVNELAQHVGKPAPSVSQHLAKLRMARLVRTRFSTQSTPVRAFLSTIAVSATCMRWSP
jgi:ArsR family transcriptional regulator, zinc-responsive transcriptional repressor